MMGMYDDTDYYGADMAGCGMQPDSILSALSQPQQFAQPMQPQQPDIARQILSARFQPTADDVGNAALAGIGGNEYVNPQAYADQRLDRSLKQLVAAAEYKKATKLDIGDLGEQAFIKSSMGMQVSPQERAALDYLDAKTQTWAFNPVTGSMEHKPSLLERAGFGRGSAAPANPQTGGQPIAGGAQPSGGGVPNVAGNMPPGITPKTRQFIEQNRADEQIKREAGYTKAQSALQGFKQQANLVTNTIDKAIGTISGSTYPLIGSTATGYGSYAPLPNTAARALRNQLDTIKANIGFDKLQQMRDNSPTGGALGQISDFENRLLQAVNGALDPAQEDQLVENLKVIKELYPQVLAEKERAFQQDYGAYTPLSGQAPTQPGAAGNMQITPEQAAAELARRNAAKGGR